MNADCAVLQFPSSSNFRAQNALRRKLLHALRASQSPVIVDFTGHCTLDHEDIGLVLECVAQSTGRDTELVFVAGSRALRIVLDVVRISSLVRVFDSLTEALASLEMPASKIAQDIQAATFELPRTA